MMKILYVLLKTKKRMLKNYSCKIDKGTLVISIILIVLAIYNAAVTGLSSDLIIRFLSDKYSVDSHNLLYLIMLFIVLLNLLTPLLFTSMNSNLDMLHILRCYSIKYSEITSYTIISEFLSIRSLISLILFSGLFLIADSSLNTLIIFKLFMIISVLLFISNLIVFSILAINKLVLSKTLYRLLPLYYFIILIPFYLVIIKYPAIYLRSQTAISILKILPSGILVDAMFETKPIPFILYMVYLIIINVFFYLINFSMIRNYGKTDIDIKTSKNRMLMRMITHFGIKSFLKKDLIYFFRGPRNISIFLLTLFIACMLGTKSFDSKDLYFVPFVSLIVSIILLGFNLFSSDYPGIINYFVLPVSENQIIKSKLSYLRIAAIIPLFLVLYLLTVNTCSIIDRLFTLILFVFNFISLSCTAILTSILFPYKVNIFKLMGRNISFPGLLLGSIVVLVLLMLNYYIITLSTIAGYSIVAMIIVILACGIILWNKSYLLDRFGALLQYRKYKIIGLN